MTLIQVDSTNIKRAGYENNKLYVEYDTGLYEYKDVPEALFTELMNAPSKGKFINSRIKYKYECMKVIQSGGTL